MKDVGKESSKVNLTPWVIAFFAGLFIGAPLFVGALGWLIYAVLAIIVYAVWAHAHPKIRGTNMLIADGFLVGLCGILIPGIIRSLTGTKEAWFSDPRPNLETAKKSPSLSGVGTHKIICSAINEGSPYILGYDRSLYSFSKDSVIKVTTVPSSYWLIWALVIEAITITFFGWIIGGVVGMFPLYLIPSALFRAFIGKPREEKLATLSFNELKAEKSVRQIAWADITKAKIKEQRLDLYFGGLFSTVLTLNQSSPQALTLLKSKLGNKLIVS